MPTTKEGRMHRAIRDSFEDHFLDTALANFSRAVSEIPPIESCKVSTKYLDEVRYIEKVSYNLPATTIIWTDGQKTSVRCCESDEYDPRIGFLLCIAKKFLKDYRYNIEVIGRLFPKSASRVGKDLEDHYFDQGTLRVLKTQKG